MPLYNITRATHEDIALLDTLLPTGGLPDTHQQRFLLQEEGKSLYLLAWKTKMLVGYIQMHFRHPPHHASCQHYPECTYIEGLTTHPDHQRQGIATALMEAAEAYARQYGTEEIGLSVGEDNAPAQALYRKLGYTSADIPPYSVSWNYLDKITGEVKEEGELCSFWIKPL